MLPSLFSAIKERGATYLEASITLLLFVTCVFFFIDAARYFYIQSVLNYAASVGVDMASKMELEVSTTSTDCPSCNGSSPCDQYKKRWNRVTQEVLRLAGAVTSSSSTPGPAQRLKFEHYYDSPQSHACLEDLESEVVFLRPGEKARRSDFHSIVYEVPGRPFSGAVGTPSGWPDSGESWVRNLREYPFGIRMDVLFKPVTPFFPAITMHIEQYGHRLTRAVGAYLPVLPTVAPTATRTATPTITPGGPTVAPTATVTGTPPTGTPTRTPVPTSTPYVAYDCSCCRPVMSAPCTFEDCLYRCSGAS